MQNFLFGILYFVFVFGFFVVYMFKRKINYWYQPLLTGGYFILATVIAIFVFNSIPIELVLKSTHLEITFLLLLYFFLGFLSFHGFFSYDKNASDRKARNESFKYLFAKSTDILFQDTLAIIIIVSIQNAFNDTTATILLFTTYFFLSHLLLLKVFPKKLALIFSFASFFAGLIFAAIVVFEIGVIYIFILHWIFYTLFYPTIKKLY